MIEFFNVDHPMMTRAPGCSPNWLLIASFHNWMSQRRFLFFGDKSRRISFEFFYYNDAQTSSQHAALDHKVFKILLRRSAKENTEMPVEIILLPLRETLGRRSFPEWSCSFLGGGRLICLRMFPLVSRKQVNVATPAEWIKIHLEKGK